VAGHGGHEPVVSQARQPDIGDRGHVCDARPVVEQCDLAEPRAATETGDHHTVAADVDLPVGDRVVAVTSSPA
jgi:hypothetical protein